MSQRPTDPLLLAGRALTLIMQGFFAFAAVALTIALPCIWIFSDKIDAKIAAEFGDAAQALPLFAISAMMMLGILAVGLAFKFFGKLRQIIQTVGEGDPFVSENADRLTAMAWLLTSVYATGAAIAGVAITVLPWIEAMGESDGNFSVGIDLSAILTIIILFILARVFRQGAAMREDLEGTI